MWEEKGGGQGQGLNGWGKGRQLLHCPHAHQCIWCDMAHHIACVLSAQVGKGVGDDVGVEDEVSFVLEVRCGDTTPALAHFVPPGAAPHCTALHDIVLPSRPLRNPVNRGDVTNQRPQPRIRRPVAYLLPAAALGPLRPPACAAARHTSCTTRCKPHPTALPSLTPGADPLSHMCTQSIPVNHKPTPSNL